MFSYPDFSKAKNEEEEKEVNNNQFVNSVCIVKTSHNFSFAVTQYLGESFTLCTVLPNTLVM